MLDPLLILPFTRPVRGSVALPGSKSITNRALLLAALGDGPVTLTGALFSEDTRLMAAALRQLGVTVTEATAAGSIRVEGRGGAIPAERAELEVGLAGTAARFLTAFCAAAPRGVFRIDGVPQMRKRPMQGLIGALRALGADIRCLGEEGFFPIAIHAGGLRGGPVGIDASASSQMLSALLMVAPCAKAPVEITFADSVRWPFVRMTQRLMQQFGVGVMTGERPNILHVATGHYHSPATYRIESDATAASYFLALTLVASGRLVLPGLREGLQGDTQFMEVLHRVGLDREMGGEATTVLFSENAVRRAVRQDFSEFSDTFLTLAAIAPLLDGPTHITGITHTRRQETDRVAGAARELRKLGQEVIETKDALEIHPRPLTPGVEIETYQDHRFAMSFAILGCHDRLGDGRPWLRIKDPGCCAKTFPDFFAVLETVRQHSLAGSA